MRDVVDSVPMKADGLDEIDLYFRTRQQFRG